MVNFKMIFNEPSCERSFKTTSKFYPKKAYPTGESVCFEAPDEWCPKLERKEMIIGLEGI